MDAVPSRWEAAVVSMPRRVLRRPGRDPLPRRRVVACRGCHRLTYRSQTEGEFDRVVRKLNQMRQRLGAGTGRSMTQRPRSMHKETFRRLSEQLDSLTALQTLRLAKAFGINVRFGELLAAFSDAK